jgi:translocation and assembly module TamB
VSDQPLPETGPPKFHSHLPMKRRGEHNWWVRIFAWTIGGLLALILLLAAGLWFYTTTADFQRRANKAVVATLETATGGRVELGHISFDPRHLSLQADHVVIHGLEGPGEAPYLSADKILVRVTLANFLAHTAGTGSRTYVHLNFLRIESPHVHLIIDKDGKTNQPVPKQKSKSNEPVIDTLLDLKAKDVELANGLALVNDRSIPFNLAAEDLNAQINFLSKPDAYGVAIDLRNLRTQMANEPEAKSSLHLAAQIGRDSAELTQFDLHSGAKSELQATAAIKNYNAPEWQAKVVGSLELKQISILAGVDGLNAGSVDLKLGGHSCDVTPATAQKKPSFFERELKRNAAKAALHKTLAPDPACTAGYLLVGSAKLHGAAYKNLYVDLHDINGGGQLHITPTQLLLTALTGFLPGGGSATGQLKIDNWLGEVPANTAAASPTVQGATATVNKTATAITGQGMVAPPTESGSLAGRAHSYLTVTTDHIPLPTVLDVTASEAYRNLGFDTAFSGPLQAEWGGPVASIADSVLVDADLRLEPTGAHRKGSEIPLSGHVMGHYDGKLEVVNVKQLNLTTPQSSLVADGVLGVNLGDSLTRLNLDLKVRDLSEYDELLKTLGLGSGNKKGAAAIPVALHGTMLFHGTASGAIAKLDVKGHLEATDVDLQLGEMSMASSQVPSEANQPSPANNLLTTAASSLSAGNPNAAKPATAPATEVHIDSLIADADYIPSGLEVAKSTITQGTAVLHIAGSFKPRATTVHGVLTHVWDGSTAIDANLQLGNADIKDLLTIAGQQNKIPVTGTIAVDAHVAGTLKNLSGSGHVALVNGAAYGEQFTGFNVDMTAQGQEIEASHVVANLHGMTVGGNGGYNLTTKQLHAHLAGNDLQLSKFNTVQNANLPADGTLSLSLDANGTAEQPGLKATGKLTNLTVEGKPVGDVTLDAHSLGSTVFYALRSTLVGAQVAADGQTQLTGDYQTQAKLTIAGLDIAKPLAIFQPDGLKATSSIAGTVTVNGPLETPKLLGGQAQFSSFTVTSHGVTLQAAQLLTISLKNGLATLQQVNITGQDTDINASGTVQVFGGVDPKSGQTGFKFGALNLKADGQINAALAHTLDPGLLTSGKVTFNVATGGVIGDPLFAGTVQFEHVNAALDGINNGLTDLNGTLAFRQNRLNVQTLTATTGGGQVTIGGYLIYRGGVFADLTLTGEKVRVRLNGLSTTANTNLHLQGGLQSALLSGTILVTRFGVGPDVDFAAFSSGGVSAPPDPSLASNKIRLDVHVTSSPQLDFQNSYAKLAGTVDLTVRGTVAVPTVLGRIQINEGSATFAGTKYQLERGDIYFSNPVRIDPIVDVDATARVENYNITLGLHGTPENLKPTYRSEPPLSEADIFSLLSLGRTQEEAQIYQEQQVQAGTSPVANSLLSGALNATVSSRVSKLFGGGSVKIDPSYIGSLGQSSARITVQRQISQQLSVVYATNVNTSAQQLIQVSYQLTPNSSLVATRDESGVFSIVYKFRRRYR